MLVRLASCASLLSFCEVLWIPKPIRDARFANSECCVAPAPLTRGLNPAGHVLRPSAVGCEGESPGGGGGGVLDANYSACRQLAGAGYRSQ